MTDEKRKRKKKIIGFKIKIVSPARTDPTKRA
jgi:hypothetical protein